MDRRPRGTPRSHASPLTTGNPSKSFEKRKRKSTRDGAALLAELEAENPLPLPLNVSLAGRLRSHNETAMADARVSTEVAAVLEEMLRDLELWQAENDRRRHERALAAKQATIDGLQAKLAEAEGAAKQEAEAAKERRGEAKKIREDLLSELWHLGKTMKSTTAMEKRLEKVEEDKKKMALLERQVENLKREMAQREGAVAVGLVSPPPPAYASASSSSSSASAAASSDASVGGMPPPPDYSSAAAAASSSSSSSSSSAAAAPSNAPQLTEAPEELRLWIMGALGGKKWKAPAADYALQLAQRVMAAPSLQFSGSSNGGIDAVVRLNAQQLIEYAGCSIAHAGLIAAW
jgi:hypothetical protein